jgi:DnaJ-class molecular chaperone
MYATHATCLDCDGEGSVVSGEGWEMRCPHCNGSGECGCDECVNTASENAFSDMCESEPPLSADERHQMAWREREELRK